MSFSIVFTPFAGASPLSAHSYMPVAQTRRETQAAYDQLRQTFSFVSQKRRDRRAQGPTASITTACSSYSSSWRGISPPSSASFGFSACHPRDVHATYEELYQALRPSNASTKYSGSREGTVDYASRLNSSGYERNW